MGTVYQRAADGLWIGSYDAGWTSGGKRRRITASAKTERECNRRLDEKILKYKTGGDSRLGDRTTVKSYAERWLTEREGSKRPKTWATDRSAIRQWIIPTIGHRRLGDLHAGDVKDVEAAQRRAGRSLSTMTRTHAVLVKLLRDATVDGAVIHAGVFAVPRAGIGQSDRESIPFNDALALLRVIETEPDPSRWVAVILNGMRQGERLGLSWPFVDFENHVIKVAWQLQELPYIDNANKHLGFRVPDGHKTIQLETRFHLTPPKTKSGVRIIPMTPWFEASLLAWREIAPTSPHGLVWCNEDGSPINPTVDRTEWERLQELAGIAHPARQRLVDGHLAPAPYVVHEGRHTTVTMLKELALMHPDLGITDEVIEQIVGQSKLVKDYVHLNLLPNSRVALEALADRLALHA
jgi:integrase